MNAFDAQKSTEKALLEAGIIDAGIESRLIISHLLNCKISEIPITEKIIDLQTTTQLKNIIEARKARQPLQYILGETEFMSLIFKVTPDTLIPRGDTERIVEAAISLMKDEASSLIADICTGSGNIAVSLAYYLSYAKIMGCDISTDALAVARENANRYSLSDRIRFLQGDLLQPIATLGLRPNLVISNPPYIKSGERELLQEEVKREPWSALDGGRDGLHFYRRLSLDSYNILSDKGYLIFETGYDQKQEVIDILIKTGYSIVNTINDYNGNHRGIIAQKATAE